MYKGNSIELIRYLARLCFMATIVAGCAEETLNNNIPCPNGREVSCTCADGQTGTRQCLNDVYTICSCGAVGSESGTSGSSTSAVTAGTGGSAASSAGAGGVNATTTRTGTAGRTANTRQTAGSGGKATKDTKITCPAPLTCESNDVLDMYLDGGVTETIRFCGNVDQGIFTNVGFSGPTPPMCKSDGNCTAIGLKVKCTSIDMGGLIFSGCLQTGCE